MEDTLMESVDNFTVTTEDAVQEIEIENMASTSRMSSLCEEPDGNGSKISPQKHLPLSMFSF